MPTWTQEEDDFVAANYYRMSATQIAGQMPGGRRSRNAIVGRAHRLGLVKKDMGQGFSRTLHPMRRPVTGSISKPPIAPANLVRTLRRTSMDERAGGMGWFKEVVVPADLPISLSDIRCEPVDLYELGKDQCRWPIDGKMYCGLRRWQNNPYGDTPYCMAHHRAGHKPVSEHRRLTERR